MSDQNTGYDNPQAILYDRYNNKVDECTFFAQPPVTSSTTLRICANFGIITNAGTSLLVLDDGLTLQPGGTFNFGSQNNPSVTIKNLNIKFENNPAIVGAQTNKLEWVLFFYNGMDQIFYKAKGKNL